MAHNATSAFLQGEVHELLKGEEQEVIGSDYKEIMVWALALAMAMAGNVIDGKKEVAHGTQAGVVGLGTIVYNGDGLGIGLLRGPFAEDGGELVVGDEDVLIDLGDAVDVIEHAAQDGALADLQQGLGEVLGEFAQTGGVTGGYDDILHSNVIL